MKRILSLLFLVSLLPFSGMAKDGAVFFARCECNRNQIIAGDSIFVDVVLYSNLPFRDAECLTKQPKIKGGTARALPMNRQRQQQKVRLESGIFYAIVWQRYVVGSDTPCNIQFPQMQFSAELLEYEEPQYDPFDPFGFFQRPQRKARTIKSQCKSDAYSLPVVARPKRSTQEVLSSGATVA